MLSHPILFSESTRNETEFRTLEERCKKFIDVNLQCVQNKNILSVIINMDNHRKEKENFTSFYNEFLIIVNRNNPLIYLIHYL